MSDPTKKEKLVKVQILQRFSAEKTVFKVGQTIEVNRVNAEHWCRRRLAKRVGEASSAPANNAPPPAENDLGKVLPEQLADILGKGGFATVEAVAGASDDELLAVKGVAAATLKQVREVIPAKD